MCNFYRNEGKLMRYQAESLNMLVRVKVHDQFYSIITGRVTKEDGAFTHISWEGGGGV